MIKVMQRWSIQICNSICFREKLFLSSKLYSNAAVKFNCIKINTMKVLNVAEKNDAAKNIAGYLSRGNFKRREGLSKFNKIYEFNCRLWNQNCQMIMTSVSGHLMGFDFTGTYRKWYGCPPLSLFDAPIVKACSDASYEKIKKSLEKEVKFCNALIIWTDCDREGENIGFEIIQVCQAIKQNIQIYRAKFSEITQISIDRALQNLERPNKAISDAVDVRSELDLRIGAAFTRFQTLRLQKAFPRNLSEKLISYGPCQFPTLGFVVERFLAIERFQPEPYWKLKVTHLQDDLTVEFRWARNRLFEKLPCQVFLDICQENPQATVEKVTSKPKSKWRPLPLDTIELEKQGSRKLHLNAKETMKIAEKLYAQGFISYPRTETNIFPKEMNLTQLVTQQTPEHTGWGRFAQRVLEEGITPRQGKKSDQAHPPIHPTKFTDSLQGNEARVYEFVVRHFLACVSKNAEGYETIVEIDIAGEKFLTNGLQIIAKNYLEVYIYEKWNAKEIHIYQQGQTFMPTSIEMLEESTSPPNLLTEADLIGLMDKYGIGTDATHAEHIETIKSRFYVGLKDNKYLMPGKLGIGLVMGYDRMGFEMSKPHLRAELENDLKLICEAQKHPDEVRQHQISKYREVFKQAMVKANMIDTALSEYLDEQPSRIEAVDIPVPVDEVPILKCPKCNSNMILKTKRQGNGKFIGCMGYPTCNNVIWLPESIEDVEVLNEGCDQCPSNILKKIRVKIARNAFPAFGSAYTACIGGCDQMFNSMMGVLAHTVRRAQDLNDTGYESNASSRTGPSQARARHGESNARHANTEPPRHNSGYGAPRNRAPDEPWNSGSGAPRSTNPTSQAGRAPAWDRGSTTGSSRDNYGWGSQNNTDIVCNCHEIAKQLTVRKEGPNQGRQFYKCAKSVGNCNFFLWADPSTEETMNTTAPATQRPSQRLPQRNWNSTSSFQNNDYQNPSSSRQNNRNTNWDDNSGGWNDSNEVMCDCGRPAKMLTVYKEGPNQGRQFYRCSGNGCKFFEWADNAEGSTVGPGRPPGPSPRREDRRRGGSSNSGPKRPRASGSTKRKCGICGVEGHTKRTCPHNAMD